MAVVEPNRFGMAVPAPQPFAAAHQVEPVRPCYESSVELHSGMQHTAIGEACNGVDANTSDYPGGFGKRCDRGLLG